MNVDYSARSKSGQILPSVGCRQPDTLQTVVRLRILWVIMDFLCSVLDCLEDRWSMWVWFIVFGIFISRMTYEETEHSTRVNSVPPFTLPFLYFFGPFQFNIITSPGWGFTFSSYPWKIHKSAFTPEDFHKIWVYPSKNIGLPQKN